MHAQLLDARLSMRPAPLPCPQHQWAAFSLLHRIAEATGQTPPAWKPLPDGNTTVTFYGPNQVQVWRSYFVASAASQLAQEVLLPVPAPLISENAMLQVVAMPGAFGPAAAAAAGNAVNRGGGGSGGV